MIATSANVSIAVLGPEEPAGDECRGCSLWAVGYAATLTAAGATPVMLGESAGGRSWNDLLAEVDGIVWASHPRNNGLPSSEEDRLVRWCRKNNFPLLAIDNALHLVNSSCGGTIHHDLCKERPEALQHRHPPEKGLRHAIMVNPNTKLADIYGEGEIVVNSEHRRAVARVAKGFRVCATALDGVVEAIELEDEKWFAMGVQWRPASATASGLDIQVFRGLIDAAVARQMTDDPKRGRVACTSAA